MALQSNQRDLKPREEEEKGMHELKKETISKSRSCGDLKVNIESLEHNDE